MTNQQLGLALSSGVVKWWNYSKGYGFLQVDGDTDNRDVFVHYTAMSLIDSLKLAEGDAVQFELVDSPKGPQALNVSRKVGV